MPTSDNTTAASGATVEKEVHDLIAQAISDPGAFVKRGDDYREPVIAWGARAVWTALRGKGVIQ